MKETFIYKQKMSFDVFYPVIAFVLMVGLCQYFHFGLAWRNLRLLAYPNSVYVVGAIALLFLISALRKWSKARKSARNPHPITVDESGVHFPYKSGDAHFFFADIEKADTWNDNDDGESLIVRLRSDGKPKRYEFFEKNFENREKFDAFSTMIFKEVPNRG